MNPSPGGRGSFLTASGDRSGVVGLWTRAVPAGAILWRGDHARISMVLMGNDRTPPVRRTTVAEAARLLGISAEAVRGRIRRGTLPVEREEGTVYVLLEGVAEDRTDADRPRRPATNRATVRNLIAPRSYPRCGARSPTSANSLPRNEKPGGEPTRC